MLMYRFQTRMGVRSRKKRREAKMAGFYQQVVYFEVIETGEV